MRFESRLKVLERPIKEAERQKIIRVLASSCGPIDWDQVTVIRRSYVAGTILEFIDLHGNCDDLDPEELEAFIERFPVEVYY